MYAIYKKYNRGFTIVELVIVIVVIAILATIATVSYNGVQRNALNAHKLSALADWRDLFQIYSSKHGGKFPIPGSPGAREYCLGRDFKYDACWNVYDVYGATGVKGSGPKADEPVAYEDSLLMDQLESVGTPPKPSTCIVAWYCPTGAYDGVGPMVSYRADKPTVVWDFFFGAKCPGGLDTIWTDGNASTCALRVTTAAETTISNLISNPSFETSTSGWSTFNGATMALSNTQKANRNNSLKVVPSSSQVYSGVSYVTPGSIGSSYTFSAYVYSQSPQAINLAADALAVNTAKTIGPSWTYVYVTGIKQSNAPLYVRARDATGVPFFIDAVMLTETATASSYADGNTPEWKWNGTPDGSTSTGPAQ